MEGVRTRRYTLGARGVPFEPVLGRQETLPAVVGGSLSMWESDRVHYNNIYLRCKYLIKGERLGFSVICCEVEYNCVKRDGVGRETVRG